MNVNICIIGGRLTRDPELRFTPKGVAIANFGIATSRKFKKDDGSENEETRRTRSNRRSSASTAGPRRRTCE